MRLAGVYEIATWRRRGPIAFAVALLAFACAPLRPVPPMRPTPVAVPAPPPVQKLVVTVTAYNSVSAQTDTTPYLTAFGVRLRPGLRVVAVSRDLESLGLEPGTRVTIEGLPGEWEVADRMAKRHRRCIDVYMGRDIEGARAFGRRRVTIHWRR